MSDCYTEQIQATDFIGDSLQRINDNFNSLQNVACSLSSIVGGVTSYGVTSVAGGNNINVINSGGTYTVSQNICPSWHTGLTRAPLLSETVANRNSVQIADLALYHKYTTDTVEHNSQYLKQAAVVRKTPLFPGSNGYRKGVTLFDGRVFFAPYNTGVQPIIYNPYNNTVTSIIGIFPSVNQGVLGGVLLPDGRVFCVPHNSTTGVLYTPSTNSFASTIVLSTGGQLYLGGTLLPNGNVLLSPYNANNIAIYNPVTNTVSYVAATPGYAAKDVYGCVLGDANNVYFVSSNNSKVLKYQLSTNSASFITPGTALPVNNAYRGGVKLANGNIMFIPYNATAAAIINITTDTISLTPNIFPGNGAFQTGALLPDGRVFLVPENYTKPVIFNPFNNTIENINTPVTPGDYYGCAVLPTGDVMLMPNNATTGLIISIPYHKKFTLAALTGPFMNKL